MPEPKAPGCPSRYAIDRIGYTRRHHCFGRKLAPPIVPVIFAVPRTVPGPEPGRLIPVPLMVALFAMFAGAAAGAAVLVGGRPALLPADAALDALVVTGPAGCDVGVAEDVEF
jgi:hypothetical protein